MVRPVKRHLSRVMVCSVGAFAGLAATHARAQSAPGLPPGLPPPVAAPRPFQDPGQRLLQDQRDQQRSDEVQQTPAQIAVPQQSAIPNLPAGADVESLPDVEPMFRITDIEFTGDTVLGKRQMDAIRQPFLGRQLGRNRINLLLRRVTEAFIAHGYITTRAYLGAQNLSSGKLEIKVVAGHVAAFTLNGKPLRPGDPKAGVFDTHGGGLVTDAGTAWAFGDSQGSVLRLPDLEQGVDQINRLRRNQAEIQILPGEAPGDSIVAITNHYGDRFYYDAGIDNYGSPQTGTLRYRAGVEADNLIGLQESLSLNYVGSENSNALVFSSAVPIGYQTVSYTTSLSEYQQAIGTALDADQDEHATQRQRD
jgi:hemolysin activation/secretion protein